MLLAILIKTTALLVAACALGFILRRASAAVRHLLWTAVLVSLLALPVLSLIVPAWPLASPVAPSTFAWTRANPTVAPPAVPAPDPGHRSAPLASSAIPAWPSWAIPFWLAGLFAALGRLAAGFRRVRRLARHAESFGAAESLLADIASQAGLRRAVSLVATSRVCLPMVSGVFHPVVLLPAAARQWPVERLRLVLLHELTHIQRRDCLTQLAAQLACALYWFHPLVWLAASRLRRERERACDDAVLRLGVRGSTYAEHLLDVARSLPRLRESWSMAVAMAQPADLESRLVAVLNPALNRRALTRRGALLAALATVALLLPLAALRAQAPKPTGKISGIVYDPSGARVPGAVVTASNVDTNSLETAFSGPAGEYQFTAIPTGHYILQVKERGFAVFERRGLAVTAGADLNLDATLQVGQVSEMVDVIGHAPRPAPPASGAAPRRIRVGGNIQATKLLSAAKPVYPDWLQAQGVEGPVVLRAVIGIDGSLLSLAVINTSPDPELARAAIEAVREWRYRPTLLNGQPVEVVTTITINYRLQAP